MHENFGKNLRLPNQSFCAYVPNESSSRVPFKKFSKIQQITGLSFQEAISEPNFESTMKEYEKLNMAAFNRSTGGITLDDLTETMIIGTRS